MTAPTGTRQRRAPSDPASVPSFTATNFLVDKKSRSEKAIHYDEKAQGVLAIFMKMFAANEATVSDAAAFIEHGNVLASKVGDLAAHDKRVAHGIDLITSGTENPYVAVAMALLPLISQVIRNHETESAKPFEIRIPFTKKTFRPKIKIKLNIPILRSLTIHPRLLIENVFGNAKIREAILESGMEVALPEYKNAREG
jgi:hypothetical protein